MDMFKNTFAQEVINLDYYKALSFCEEHAESKNQNECTTEYLFSDGSSVLFTKTSFTASGILDLSDTK